MACVEFLSSKALSKAEEKVRRPSTIKSLSSWLRALALILLMNGCMTSELPPPLFLRSTISLSTSFSSTSLNKSRENAENDFSSMFAQELYWK